MKSDFFSPTISPAQELPFDRGIQSWRTVHCSHGPNRYYSSIEQDFLCMRIPPMPPGIPLCDPTHQPITETTPELEDVPPGLLLPKVGPNLRSTPEFSLATICPQDFRCSTMTPTVATLQNSPCPGRQIPLPAPPGLRHPVVTPLRCSGTTQPKTVCQESISTTPPRLQQPSPLRNPRIPQPRTVYQESTSTPTGLQQPRVMPSPLSSPGTSQPKTVHQGSSTPTGQPVVRPSPLRSPDTPHPTRVNHKSTVSLSNQRRTLVRRCM